jgi:hypothetical protein
MIKIVNHLLPLQGPPAPITQIPTSCLSMPPSPLSPDDIVPEDDVCAFVIIIIGDDDNIDNESMLVPITTIKNPYFGLFLLIAIKELANAVAMTTAIFNMGILCLSILLLVDIFFKLSINCR